MRFLKTIVIFLAIISVVFTGILVFKDYGKHNPPTIVSSTNDKIVVNCGATDEELLGYVTATDPEDGDISSKIVVYREPFFLEKGVSAVVFSVCDSDNNVGTLKCQLEYSDYDSPHIELHDSLIFHIGSKNDLSTYFSATDKIDGDISDNLKIISPQYDANREGTYLLNCKVSNSFGDTRSIDIDAIVEDTYYNTATIKLSNYLIYVKVGDMPDFSSMISGVTNLRNTKYEVKDVEVDSSGYNPNEAGAYNIFYTVSDATGVVAKSRLIVIVEEA